MTFKKINAWFHLWFGIASGIIVVILGITGCILVFEHEIKSITSPWLHAEQPGEEVMLPPSALYQSASKAFPEREIHSVWYHGEGRTAHLSTETDSLIYINPYTAEIAAVVKGEDFFHFIEEGHFYLWFPPEIGKLITGWGSLIFFLILISGIILWWPKRWNKRSTNKSFTIRWKAKIKRLNYDLHNVLGFYSLIIAAIIAFTALMMSFSWFNQGVFWLTGGKEQPRVEAVSDTLTNLQTDMLKQVDKAWYKGINEIAEHNTKEIILHYPEEASEAIYVCVDMYSGTWRDVYLDQYTLKELPASDKRLRDENISNWIRRANYGLHVGEIGGLTTKFIYFIVSLIIASLPITGFCIWWGKKKKKSRKRIKPTYQQT